MADDCDIPMYLRNKVYVDIRQRDQYDKGVALLIRAVRCDTQILPADVVSADLGDANQDELCELPRWQFALETCVRNQKYIARTVRTVGAMANLLPKQVITYCEEAPHLAVCPTIDAAGEIYYGLKTRILERYGTEKHYGEEMALYLRSLRIHASPTYTVDELSYFLGFHELS